MPTQIDVGVHVSKLIQDPPKQGELVSNIMTATMKGTSVANAVKKALFNGIHSRVEATMEHARNYYYLGLPKSRDTFKQASIEEITRVMRSVAGEPVNITYQEYDYPSAEIVAKAHLQDSMGWDPISNEIKDLETTEYIAKYNSAAIKVHDAASNRDPLSVYKVNAVIIQYDRFLKSDGSQVDTQTYQPLVYENDFVKTGEAIYHVIYTLPSESDAVQYYWFYNPREAQYSDLHISEPSSNAEYLPVILLRRNGLNINHEPTIRELFGEEAYRKIIAEEWDIRIGPLDPAEWPQYDITPLIDYYYIHIVDATIPLYDIEPKPKVRLHQAVQSTEDVLRYLGISYSEILDSVNANPDIDKIDDVFITFVVGLDTEVKETKEYLLLYFQSLWEDAAGRLRDPNSRLNHSIEQGEFNMNITITHIYIYDRTGDMATAPTEFNVSGDEISVGTDLVQHFDEEITFDFETGVDSTGLQDKLRIRKKTGDNSYIEMYVIGLRHESHIYKDKVVYRTLRDVDGLADDSGLYLPVSMHIVRKMPVLHRAALYYDTLSLLSHSVSITHLKWYEDPDFLNGVFIVIAVIAFVIGAVDIATTIATAGWQAAAQAAAIAYIKAKVIVAIGVEVLEELGINDAVLLAIIAVAVIYTTQDSETVANLLDAETLLKSVTLFAQSTETYVQNELDSLYAEFQNLDQEMEELQEEIDKAKDMLSSEIDILDVVRAVPYLDINESPSDFIYRTVENTNPGVLALKGPEVYVENALKLPKFNSYLGTMK